MRHEKNTVKLKCSVGLLTRSSKYYFKLVKEIWSTCTYVKKICQLKGKMLWFLFSFIAPGTSSLQSKMNNVMWTWNSSTAPFLYRSSERFVLHRAEVLQNHQHCYQQKITFSFSVSETRVSNLEKTGAIKSLHSESLVILKKCHNLSNIMSAALKAKHVSVPDLYKPNDSTRFNFYTNRERRHSEGRRRLIKGRNMQQRNDSCSESKWKKRENTAVCGVSVCRVVHSLFQLIAHLLLQKLHSKQKLDKSNSSGATRRLSDQCEDLLLWSVCWH